MYPCLRAWLPSPPQLVANITLPCSSLTWPLPFVTDSLCTALPSAPQLVANVPVFKQAEGEQPLMLLPGRPPLVLALDQPLSATGAVKDGQKQVGLGEGGRGRSRARRGVGGAQAGGGEGGSVCGRTALVQDIEQPCILQLLAAVALYC